MNALNSPFEAFAFNSLSFGFLTVANNLWTCLAVLTGALSFWRIRAAGCPKPHFMPLSDDRTSDPDSVPEASVPDAVSEQPRPAFVSTVVSNGDADVDGVRKGKFTVYYEDDGQCETEGLLTVTEEWEEREGGRGSEWWESWDKLLRMRTGEYENGWYTWQDLTALNGNVVRFWDDGIRESQGTAQAGSRSGN